MNFQIWYAREQTVYWLAALSSLLLSLWVTYNQSVINPDAICYLLSAESIGEQGISNAMSLCGQAKWPFYSMLIYALVKISHLSYPLAAYCADGFFSLITVLLFILIVKELGGNLRTLWFASATILLSHQFNGIREYIVRDHGFWAFYLLSFWLLLCFFRKPDGLKGMLWNASILIASLFRIEGVIFLSLLPFLSFLYTHYTWPQRYKLFCRLNVLTAFLLLGIVIWGVIHPGRTAHQFGRLQDIWNQLQNGLTLVSHQYQASTMKLATQVLSHDAMGSAGQVFLIMMLGWYFISVATNLSWVYSVLAFYAWRRRLVYFPFSARLVLGGYLLVNLFITMGFLFEHLFLSKRYLIGLTLVLMVWVPFALNHLYERSFKLRYRLALGITLFLIALSSLGGIFDFGYSKDYIRQAGLWIVQYIPKNALLYANDYQLMYYSHHFNNDIFTKMPSYVHANLLAEEQWKQYDYLALRMNKKDGNPYHAVIGDKRWLEVASFHNKRGDEVSIYKVRNE